MPSEVRMITPSKLSASGPNIEVNGPAMALPSAGICERFTIAVAIPPWPFNTAKITAMIPMSMIVPWMKSFQTEAT